MAEYAAMPLWTDAYLGDTTHLTTIEHGAYLLLLMAMWRADGKLPNDDKLLARYARVTAGQWKRIKPVLWPFFRVSSDSITQGRLTDELEAVRQKSRRQSDNAKSRWLKTNETDDATALPPQSHGYATHTHTHTTNTDANASDADSVDFTAVIFDRGVKFLVGHGTPERQARSVIGKWRKDHEDRDIFDAFTAARKEGVVDPVPWITARLQPKPSNTINIRDIMEGRA